MSAYCRFSLLLLAFLTLLGGTGSYGGLVDSAEKFPGGWLYLDWFGWFYEDSPGHINHAEHGLLSLWPGNDNEAYYYEYSTDSWYYTSKLYYPYLYKYGANNGWYYYYRGGKKGERWFYRVRDGKNLMESKINLNDSVEEGFSLIRAGTFLMGSPEDELGRNSINETQRSVTIPHDYIVSQYEVSVDVWNAISFDAYLYYGYTDLPVGGHLDDGDRFWLHPVIEVSWYDAVKWLNAYSEMKDLDPCYRVNGEVYRTGESKPQFDIHANGYRLLTEAEWEYACRAGSTTAFYWGPISYLYIDQVEPILDFIGWYGFNSDGITHIVGLKQENQYGLYDMAGNVWEWCWNYYVDNYYGGPDTTGPSGGTKRVVRGGSVTSGPAACRSAHRFSFYPNLRGPYVGFRIARTQLTP